MVEAKSPDAEQQEQVEITYEYEEPDYWKYANRLMFEDGFVDDPTDEEEVEEVAAEFAEKLVLDEAELRERMLKASKDVLVLE